MMLVNKRTIALSNYDVQGCGLAQLAREAREQLLADALRYTRSYRDVSVSKDHGRIILAGHQPEMFHPGVWFKDFAIARLANDHDAVAVNLQIDSDAMKTASLRVPGGSVDQPRMEYVPFDRVAPEAPFEQRTIIDRACFESFGERACKHLQSLIPQPLLRRYWPLAVARSRETNHLGASLSQARHQCEAGWGLQTLELPQSQVCDLPAMRWFIAHLLAQLPRFWEAYNSALLEYRREHKVRSAAHPVPELDSVDDWLEAPLWIWTQTDPRRRRLFVRQQNNTLVLSDREQCEVVLPITPESGAAAAVEQLSALSSQGIRLRTRALITTMAARLLMGELFVHGIGGAKYDQLTDRIIERFFGLEPPGYLVASGTLRLPLAHSAIQTDDVQQIRQQIRELEFHPERFLENNCGASVVVDEGMAGWIAEKRRWLTIPPTPANARQRGRAIRQANEALQPAVTPLRESWLSEVANQAERQRAEVLLVSREYAFPLFPEPDLKGFLLPILEISDGNG
ncbi:MAG TPA: hypothetical protein VFE46_17255 [Pirellulales bacterium]|jgi:hypothetical protein|nr:hypothetical protein [Pirellulales bacterium]